MDANALAAGGRRWRCCRHRGAGRANELSTTDRLKDRREVAAGTRAYSIGFEDGRFYANGWHITGEMGGIWAPPLKLADGVWFGVDGQWAGAGDEVHERPRLHPLRPAAAQRPATCAAPTSSPTAAAPRCSGSSWPTRRRGQDRHGQGRRALRAAAAPTRGRLDGTPDRGRQPARTAAAFDGRRARRSRDRARCPAARRTTTRRWSPPRGARRRQTGPGFRGPQPGTVCKDGDKSRRARCDDGPFGKGTGGELRYRVTVPARRPRDASGSRSPAPTAARGRPARARRGAARPGRAAARRRSPSRDALAAPLAGRPARRPQLQEAVDWGKQNLADLTQTRRRTCRSASSTRARPYPRAAGTRQARDVHRRRLPRLPVAVRHRRRVHGVRGRRARPVRGDQGPPERAARRLRHRSTTAPARSRTRSSPTARSTSAPTPTPGNTDETVKFPSAVALVWRWTGDDRFRDELYDFSRRATCTTSRTTSTPTRTAGPRASATSSATGMGAGEARQRRLLHPRPLRPRRHGARQARPRDARRGPRGLADDAARALRRDLVERGLDAVRGLAQRRPTRSSSRSTGSASRRWRPS